MSKTVLIVDDNEPIRKLLKGIAESAGYITFLAENGEAALKLAKENKIDCALIDQYMDPMDGFTLARQFNVIGQRFPMTMITANESNDLLLQARKHGFISIMVKPVNPDRLLKILERMTR